MKLLLRILRLITRHKPHVQPKPLPGFDEAYYLHWYRDVQTFSEGPLAHYLRHGWMEGRDPSAGFSTDGYLNKNLDVRASGGNPLIHFLEFGLAEGRTGWQKDPNAPPPRPMQHKAPQKPIAAPNRERNR